MSYAPDAAPERGWFGRNWLWFVPLMLLLLAVVACGGCVALGVLFGERFAAAAIQMMPEFQQAMTILGENAEVREALGEPVEMDGLPTKMDQGFSGQTITRAIAFRAKGPKASATVELDSETVGSNVRITRLEVSLPDGKTLDLTPAATTHEPTTQGDAEAAADESAPSHSTEPASTEAESGEPATP